MSKIAILELNPTPLMLSVIKSQLKLLLRINVLFIYYVIKTTKNSRLKCKIVFRKVYEKT